MTDNPIRTRTDLVLLNVPQHLRPAHLQFGGRRVNRQELTGPRLCVGIVDRFTFGSSIIETGTDFSAWPRLVSRLVTDGARLLPR